MNPKRNFNVANSNRAASPSEAFLIPYRLTAALNTEPVTFFYQSGALIGIRDDDE